MQNVHIIRRGLDIPLDGAPEQVIREGPRITKVALVADDFPGMKPTMMVAVGDRVRTGEKLFEDKKNPGVFFTAPGCGRVTAIQRGSKRKFEELVIELDGDESLTFQGLENRDPSRIRPEEIRKTLLDAGLWTAFRTRPFGRIPSVDQTPASLFVTAIDTEPLAADPAVIIHACRNDFRLGLEILGRFLPVPLHLCLREGFTTDPGPRENVIRHYFRGPHPAGLPSTHIHFIDPVHENKSVWHICYQDVIGIGHLFRTGKVMTDRIVSLAGPGVISPVLLRTRAGALIGDLCAGLLDTGTICRMISGSVLNGRHAAGIHQFLGRYDRQVTVIPEKNGRGFLNWLRPGADRYSITSLFLSSFLPGKRFSLSTAVWGGTRAIFPLGTYEKVMPLDLIVTALLKSLAVGDEEKAAALGCLELVEEDLALCSFVCPAKNEYGPMLRDMLTRIEKARSTAG
ncbi:MAG: Na(+)-translocating NADH-quinone reductase subunit A [Desulfobulbaceae bacterium]